MIKQLYINTNYRYCLDEKTELHSGDAISISIDGVNWVDTTIECADGSYYATINPKLNLVGLYAKIK